MRIVLAILLNAALLAVLLPWLWRQWWQVRGWVRAAMAISLGARLVVGLVTSVHLEKDAYFMSQLGKVITAQFWAQPEATFQTLMGDELHYAGWKVVYHGMSNTFFFAKIVACGNLGSLGTDWLNAVYFSLFSFVGCWQLTKALVKAFPQTPAAAGAIAFGLWPSVAMWASGITKESMVLGSGAWLLALFIELFFGKKRLSKAQLWLHVIGLLMLTIVHFKMRYFFAAPFIGGLAALALMLWLQQLGLGRSRWVFVLVLSTVLSGGLWLASEVSIAFRPNKFFNQVTRIYGRLLTASKSKPHFEYPDLQPTVESIVRHIPEAVANTLTRPWLGESTQPLYVAAALENALLLVLITVSLFSIWQGRPGRLPFGLMLVLLVHCLALAVLLGLSSPNMGSMHRYRSGMLPYLVLLLLQNNYATAGLRRLGMRNEEAWPVP